MNSCASVRASNAYAIGIESEQRCPREVRDDEYRPAAQTVDPDARRQAEKQERRELDDGQRSDLERRSVQDDDRDERDRQSADLRAELADSFGRPEFEEVRVAPEAALRPELHDRSLSSEPAFRAGARSIRTSPDTVFANSSTSVDSPSGTCSVGTSVRSSSETVEPLTVLASTIDRASRAGRRH